MKTALTLAAALLTVAASGSALADAIPYPASGAQNPVAYSFTAAVTGNVSAYFLGSNASYNEYLGLLVNGVDTGITGLENHSTTVGTQLDFGNVTAGSALVFYIKVTTTGDTWYSNVSQNTDGVNHIYSTSYTGAAAPHGTYVAFEDLPASGSDYNYADEQFVFTNVAATPAVPEPTSMVLLLAGLGCASLLTRFRRLDG